MNYACLPIRSSIHDSVKSGLEKRKMACRERDCVCVCEREREREMQDPPAKVS